MAISSNTSTVPVHRTFMWNKLPRLFPNDPARGLTKQKSEDRESKLPFIFMCAFTGSGLQRTDYGKIFKWEKKRAAVNLVATVPSEANVSSNPRIVWHDLRSTWYFGAQSRDRIHVAQYSHSDYRYFLVSVGFKGVLHRLQRSQHAKHTSSIGSWFATKIGPILERAPATWVRTITCICGHLNLLYYMRVTKSKVVRLQCSNSTCM